MTRARTVEVREIGTVHEVLRLAGRPPRSTLQRWRRGDFPPPIRTVGRRVELWDLGHVRAWLHVRKLNLEDDVSARIVEPGVFEAVVGGELLGRFRVDVRGRVRRAKP